MKKVMIISLVFLIASALDLSAQITSGQVSFDINVSSEDPQMSQAVVMMKDSEMDMYFTEGKSRVVVSMGDFMTVTTVVVEETDEMLMLMESMMGKIAISSTIDEMQGMEDTPDFDVELVNESKEIAGYKCKKAILTDGSGNKVTYWYTDKIKAITAGQSNMDVDVPGFALEFEAAQNGMYMKYTATKVSKSLEKDESSLFSIAVPEGYQEMSIDELMNMGM